MAREHEVERLRQQIEREYSPRLRMLVITLVTAGVGFLADFGFLSLGVGSMALRYMLALGLAYSVFLLMVRWWASRFDKFDAIGDGIDIISPLSGGDVSPVACEGAGASSSTLRSVVAGMDGEAMPLIMVAALIVAALGLFLSCVWIIYDAPVLFAELCLDSVLAAGLYKRLRQADQRHWMESVVRRTWRPLSGVALALLLVAGAAHHYAPGAMTLGQALQRAELK